MGKVIDLTGRIFGRLTVIERVGKSHDGRITWLCQCECGNKTIVNTSGLTRGDTKSCGCLKTKHGLCYSKEYITWVDMLRRCYNPKREHYKNYGARGIKVCDGWKSSFEAFFKDMGECPEDYSLDRIDNDGNYEPSNCRWATAEEQSNNRRNNVVISYDSQTESLSYFAQKYDIPYATLHSRIKLYNWSVEKALTTPIRGRANANPASQ